MQWVGTQNICMQTHLTYLLYPEKFYQLPCLFLDILYDKPRDSISLYLYELPAKKGLRHLDP